jgi:hypothetical protein
MEVLQTSPLGHLGTAPFLSIQRLTATTSIPYVRLAAKSGATFGPSLPRTRFPEMPRRGIGRLPRSTLMSWKWLDHVLFGIAAAMGVFRY